MTALTDFARVCDESDRVLERLREHPAFPPLGPLTRGRLGDARASSVATIDQRQALGREVAELLAAADAARSLGRAGGGTVSSPAVPRPAVGPPPGVDSGDHLERPELLQLLVDIATWQADHLRRLNGEAVSAAWALVPEMRAVDDPGCRALAARLERFASAAGRDRS